ncbi:MAG: DNA-3-methyladenine glycosylase I, partial [Anaerolineales bacterium]|nr:DNA-3-methyladenine glycosylase I [Anaerolineales bacterium]
LDIMDRLGSFSDFLWSFTDGKTFKGPLAKTWQDIPTTNSQSEMMSKALRAEGFKFVGDTICYAFMQAVGIIDDHLVDCFRFSGR